MLHNQIWRRWSAGLRERERARERDNNAQRMNKQCRHLADISVLNITYRGQILPSFLPYNSKTTDVSAKCLIPKTYASAPPIQ